MLRKIPKLEKGLHKCDEHQKQDVCKAILVHYYKLIFMMLSCFQILGLLSRHVSTKDVSVSETRFLQLFDICASSNYFQNVYIDFPTIKCFHPTPKRGSIIFSKVIEIKTSLFLYYLVLKSDYVSDYVMDIN